MSQESGRTATGGSAGFSGFDNSAMTRTHWRWAMLTVLAHYFDAGAIVAGAVSLTIWSEAFGMSNSTLGLITALGPNAIGCGIGALVGGWLGDKLGRKRIFSIDLLVFAVGALIVAFAPAAGFVVVGYLLVGLAVGVDIPTSESLLAEFTPAGSRGKVFGLSVVSWLMGPVVVSLLAAGLTTLGLWSPRIIFIHLAVVALLVWWARRKFPESPRWLALHGHYDKVREAAQVLGLDPASVPQPGSAELEESRRTSLREVFTPRNLRKLSFTLPLYVIWGIPAGTYGMFLPYLLENVSQQSALLANLVNVLNFGLGVAGALLFMVIGDRFDRRAMWAVGAAVSSLAFFVFFVVPPTNLGVIIVHVVLVAGLGGFAATPIIRLWSIEPFPTHVRGTMQSLSFGTMRIVLGFWSLAVVGLLETKGFIWLAAFLGGIWALLTVLGGVFGPNTTGKSVDELERT